MRLAWGLAFGLAAPRGLARGLGRGRWSRVLGQGRLPGGPVGLLCAHGAASTVADRDACCAKEGREGSTVSLVSEESAPSGTSEKAKKAKAKCPVSGDEISKDVSVPYRGGKVYFCCEDCIKPFKKDQAKYEAKANLQLVATGQAVQKACPITGNKVNEEVKVEIEGVPVAFCCTGCQGKVKKAEAAERTEMVFGKNFEKGFAMKEKHQEKKSDQ